MAVADRTPLGATTTNRKWFLDVDAASDAATPDWTGVHGITAFTPGVEGSLQDDSDFDGGGWGSQTNTRNAWANELTVKRGTVKGSTPKVYDPGQEILRLAGARTGEENSVHVRWYEMERNGPRVEAYEGWAAVTWTDDGGDSAALSTATITLTGQGERIEIAHPDTTAG